jgi:hypothetical protein
VAIGRPETLHFAEKLFCPSHISANRENASIYEIVASIRAEKRVTIDLACWHRIDNYPLFAAICLPKI